MNAPIAPASDLERRKQVRLRRRSDIEITPQKYEGRTYWVIKDPVSLRYYRFKEQEYFLLEMMDGKHTLDDAQKAFEKRFRPDRLTLEDLEQFGQQLLKAGLVHNETPQAGKLLYENLTKRKRQKLLQSFTNILYIKIPIFDPEKLLVKMLPWVRFVFTGWFFALSVIFMLSALMLVLTHFDTFRERLPSFHEFFSLKTVFYLWAALGVVKVIHEFGHGLSCKAFGGEVHEMGFLLLCLSPAMYCNVSDAWTLPNKWKRIIISGAGIYVELMIAALATFVWWNTPGQPFVNYMALSLMFVCSVNTVVFNGNPLMRFDGYYVLSDLLEIPNLREKANRYLKRVVTHYGFGVEVQPEPYMAPWRRVLFVTYAIASYVYRWVVTFTIIYFLSTFLGPKLRVVSQLLALFALGSLLGWPTYNAIKAYRKRGRLPDMKRLNTTITVTLLAVAILAFLFLPLPINRIRQTGVVQVQPRYAMPVPVKISGILEKIYGLREGQRVDRGAPLARFRNLEEEKRVDAARAEFARFNLLVREYRSRKLEADNPAAEQQFDDRLREAENKLAMAKVNLELQSKLVNQMLTLRAPCAGVVMGLPKPDAVGKLWDKEEGIPFCTIADPKKLRVLVPISPDEYELLMNDLVIATREGRDLNVLLRVQGRGSRTWKGRIAPGQIPKYVAETIPLELSAKAGGPLAVKPTSTPEQLIPQTQVYLVPVEILEPDDAIVPGNYAQVKIQLGYRSLGWWVWRWIAKTFHLRLL